MERDGDGDNSYLLARLAMRAIMRRTMANRSPSVQCFFSTKPKKYMYPEASSTDSDDAEAIAKMKEKEPEQESEQESGIGNENENEKEDKKGDLKRGRSSRLGASARLRMHVEPMMLLPVSHPFQQLMAHRLITSTKLSEVVYPSNS